MILTAALFMFVQVEAAAGGEAPELNCVDPQAQLELNMCAWRDFESSDAALNAQWAETSARMKALDEDIDAESDEQPGHFETLLEGQRAWLRFRDAQCRSESFMARGGSLQPMLVAQCMAYMTELRTQQLRDLATVPE